LQKYESIAARPMPNTDLAWGQRIAFIGRSRLRMSNQAVN